MKICWKRLGLLLLTVSLLSGCGQLPEQAASGETSGYTEETLLEEVDLEEELVALTDSPAVASMLLPEATGILVKKNNKAVIDYSEATKKSVPTSQPSTGDFLKLFSDIPAEDPIIVLCICSTISGTYNGALLSARQSGRKNITVINTRTTAIGMIHLLEDGLDMIEKGLSYEEIAKALEEASMRTGLTVALDTIDYLKRGGRIGKAAGLIGSILKIKPVIYLNENNEVDALGKVRTTKKANALMIDYLKKQEPLKRLGIVHIENEAGAKVLYDKAKEMYPDMDITLTTATPVLTAYLGPGLTGFIFERAK